jgi:hypothetical protein
MQWLRSFPGIHQTYPAHHSVGTLVLIARTGQRHVWHLSQNVVVKPLYTGKDLADLPAEYHEELPGWPYLGRRDSRHFTTTDMQGRFRTGEARVRRCTHTDHGPCDRRVADSQQFLHGVRTIHTSVCSTLASAQQKIRTSSTAQILRRGSRASGDGIAHQLSTSRPASPATREGAWPLPMLHLGGGGGG